MKWEDYKDELDTMSTVDGETERRFLEAAGQRRPASAVRVVRVAGAACILLAVVGSVVFWRPGTGLPVSAPSSPAGTAASETAAVSDTTEPTQAPASSGSGESTASPVQAAGTTTASRPAGAAHETGNHSLPSGSAEADASGTSRVVGCTTRIAGSPTKWPGYLQKMTYEELCVYYGRDFLPEGMALPADLTEHYPSEEEHGIWKGAPGNLSADFNSYTYSSGDNPERRATITVSKGRLPKMEGWHLGEPSAVEGITVYSYSPNDFPTVGITTETYIAYFLVDGVGYGVHTDELSEAEFWAIIQSIIRG